MLPYREDVHVFFFSLYVFQLFFWQAGKKPFTTKKDYRALLISGQLNILSCTVRKKEDDEALKKGLLVFIDLVGRP